MKQLTCFDATNLYQIQREKKSGKGSTVVVFLVLTIALTSHHIKNIMELTFKLILYQF